MRSQTSPEAARQTGSSALAELIDQVTARLQAGEEVDVEALALEHPRHAEELRRLLPALGALAELSRSRSACPLPAEEEELRGVLGDFRLLREVGRGGMGVVYEAEQISLGRRVALKVLPYAAVMDARAMQRFQNEVRAAASLHHEHIVAVHFVGCERGVHFYAMQFIDGRTLAELIAAQHEPTTAYPAAAPHSATTAVGAEGRTKQPRKSLFTREGRLLA